jgi:GT2 family glycosyltransferase
MRESFPAVQILKLTDNQGYAGNNNLGIRIALEQGAEWVLLLNNDTVVDSDCITTLVESAVDRGAAVAGPMVYHHDEPDTIQSAGGTLSVFWRGRHIGQNERERHQYPDTRVVDWVSGCALMASRDVFERVGTLDERYFMYWEEMEWCLRVRRAGGVVLHVPDAKVWHKGVKRNYEPSPAVTYYSTRNLLLTLWIHRAPRVARLVRSLYIVRLLATWTLRPKWRRSKADHRDAVWQGTVDYLRGRWGPMPH